VELLEKQPTIALLPWGDLIEDFLDTIGISFEAFCNEMTGGWLFGYVEALKLVGTNTIVFCISARVQQMTRYAHKPTGATICVLPAPNIHTQVRRLMLNPYSSQLEETFQVGTPFRQFFVAVLRDTAPYLANPIRILAQVIRHEGCQAILCQEYEYARFDICVLLGKLLNIPVFASFQGGNFQLSRLEAPLRPFTLKACAGLIVASQTERDRLQTRYGLPASKIAPIFNPLDLSLWHADRTDLATLTQRQQTRAELGIPPEALVVVNHGRMEIHRKGLDILLEAWQQICRDRPHYHLVLLLIGTGSDADALAQRIAELCLSNIVWVNEYILDRAVMRRYLLAADLYTLPSRHEGFPVAPIEAMACGLPIVATDAPGIPDILVEGERSGGLMVARDDPNALAEAIDCLLDNATWRSALGKLAQQRVAAAFSLKSVGQQLRQTLNL
jgi:starch synthase